MNGQEIKSYGWTDPYEGAYSFDCTVFTEEFDRVINYGSDQNPFRFRFKKVLKIGFIKR